ncbi:MAG: family 20 glycosylhydrolase [Phycisphaera sp.]|nr:family 20 glycosylhydrolase [Phycisphaera sp.]
MTAGLFHRSTPAIPRRGVHLDLKGLPPTPERFVCLLRLLAGLRYDTVLIEWEDSFPWTVDERFRSPTAYTPADVQRFMGVASELGLDCIPLVQCLGHMETPLSVPGYEKLREVPDVASSLNPLDPASRELVQKMVDDVLRLMPGVTHFHLGGDESWTFGQNPRCASYIEKYGKGALYLQHVEPILDALIARGIRPILWHDMMTHWQSDALHALAEKCDLMTWGYYGHPDHTQSHYKSEYCQRFKDHGFTLWGATAYKGAGDTPERHMADRPDPTQRQVNALAWAQIAQRLDYVGVIATGWSRWATDTVQCIPIDAALDTLALVAVILHDGAPPEGGLASCVEALQTFNEKARFVSCRDAMERLTDLRRRAWQQVQFTRQQLTLAGVDPRRPSAKSTRMGMKVLPQLGKMIDDSGHVGDEVRRSLDGLVEPSWIEEYLHTRLAPLKEEYDSLCKILTVISTSTPHVQP